MKIFKKLIPTAAAACIVAGITVAVVFLTLGNGGAHIAWADVQEHIRNARTMTFKMTTEIEGSPNKKVDEKVMFKEPGLMRREMVGPTKRIIIMDQQQGKMIILEEATKKAIILYLPGFPAEGRENQIKQNFLTGIKKLIEESETELGEKEIDGRAAKGYRVEKGNQTFTIWADAETGQPVEVNMTMFQGEARKIMSDFEFDVELDESLFSLEVPEGYIIEKQQIESKEASTEDLVVYLRFWAKVRGGTFPDVFTPGRFVKDCREAGNDKFKEMGITSDKDIKKTVGPSINRAWDLLRQHKGHYAGKGVKLGEADKAVFWYKPTDSETYKVIYGDLSVKDVAEENLPAKPNEEAGSE